MKIIDQTSKVIKRQRKDESKPRSKNSFPGLLKLSKQQLNSPKKDHIINQTQFSSSTTFKENTLKSSQEGNINTHLDLDSIFEISKNALSDTSLLLQKELSQFMQPQQHLNIADLHSFDFNDHLNIENISNDWLEFVSPTSTADSHNSETIRNEDPKLQILESKDVQNEFRLACHYCRVMTRFYSVKDPEWNFYSMVNQEFAYRYEPLKFSILAWSSLHLSIQEKSSTKTAHKYYQQALKSIMNQNFLKSEIPLEILLVGSFFLCLFDIMAGNLHTTNILRHVYGSLKIGSLFEMTVQQTPLKESTGSLSPFSYQIITWLIYLDIRSSLFVGNIQFPNYITFEAKKKQNKPKNGDIQYLLSSDVYEEKVVSNIFDNSRSVLRSSFGGSYPNEVEQSDILQDRILVLMMKNMLMFGTLIRLKNWLDQCGNSVEFNPQTLKAKINDLYEENIKLLEINATDRVSQFHISIEMALIHAIRIYFDRICTPDIRTNLACQETAEQIFKIAVSLKALRPQGTPGSIQWPFPLVIAGIETTNPIYQSWILRELEDCEKEGWGLYVTKSKNLCIEVMKRQNATNQRVDVGEAMKELFDGYFIV
ncbi:unnamed protein product [Wickerhamomyces anomalus]